MNDLKPIPLPEINAISGDHGPEIESLTSSDLTPLACRVWQGQPGQPVILYLHGIEGHSQWFESTARVLHQRGMTIYAPDRRGSGLNTKDRGHLASFKVFVADVENILRAIAVRHSAQPLFLFANCWSAKAAAVIASRTHVYNDRGEAVKLSGLIMTCPAIVNKVDFDLISKFKIAFSTFAGELSRRSYWPVPLSTDMLTDNSIYLEYLNKDPLRLRSATSQFFRETFVLSLLAQVCAKDIRLPVLVLQAANDQIVNIPALQNWYNRVGSSDKQWRTFAGATHSLDFDSRWFDEYTNLLSEWLAARTMSVVA